MSIAIIKNMVAEASNIVVDGEGYQVLCPDEDGEGFDAIHEETGDNVFVSYEEMDLTRDFFYKLSLMSPIDYCPQRVPMDYLIVEVDSKWEVRSIKRGGMMLGSASTYEEAVDMANKMFDMEEPQYYGV